MVFQIKIFDTYWLKIEIFSNMEYIFSIFALELFCKLAGMFVERRKNTMVFKPTIS